MAPSTMPNIEHIVVLMLENRSLDNLFGHLYKPADRDVRFYPEGSLPMFDGIPIGASNPAFDWGGTLQNYPVLPIPVEELQSQGNDPSIIPWWDPTEEWLSVLPGETGRGVRNQLFGNQNMYGQEPPFGTRAGMLGFLQDYWTISTDSAYGGMDILWTFRPEQIPYLSTVARLGAISDAWFSSVPTQTNPNRAYSLLGTSHGRESNLHYDAIEKFHLPTIFNALAAKGKSCGLYYVDEWQDQQCFTQYTFPHLTGTCEIATTDVFFKRAADGTLPAFTYLEPKWGYGISGLIEPTQGTDLHPPSSVTPGDQVVGLIASALIHGKKFDRTLFIITFDEHGGTYDHVPPPWGAINPDGRRGASGFDFNLFGARVPTILFGPWVPSGSVFRAPAGSKYPFDHTSLIKTLLGWAGADIGTAGFFNRMPQAPAFDYFFVKTDREAVDNAAALQLKFELFPPPPTAPSRPRDDRFEGIGFASVRHIIRTSRAPEQLVNQIAEYRRDPEAFEAKLGRD